eukprot:scaffold18269_cov71-Phaeocystis_antarctica.AAC.8
MLIGCCLCVQREAPIVTVVLIYAGMRVLFRQIVHRGAIRVAVGCEQVVRWSHRAHEAQRMTHRVAARE